LKFVWSAEYDYGCDYELKDEPGPRVCANSKSLKIAGKINSTKI